MTEGYIGPDGCCLRPEQYHYLWKTSWCFLVATLYGAYKGHYAMLFAPGGVFITSILFWRKPTYGWLRDLDMYYVKLANEFF